MVGFNLFMAATAPFQIGAEPWEVGGLTIDINGRSHVVRTELRIFMVTVGEQLLQQQQQPFISPDKAACWERRSNIRTRIRQ